MTFAHIALTHLSLLEVLALALPAATATYWLLTQKPTPKKVQRAVTRIQQPFTKKNNSR